ncbi:uncharacterized protein LOC129602631 [Paramacrobiotus metropolitanus]|uniref:uncharacterized protein LOC129602631 n=1 Tax=Paramacrobiotus metropolitanus TaxID=2943436 RepID=UPI0024463119|nr:uncharacterized protein LOC129602631 [Paramacrobiotus metropolitanus]
MMRYFPTVIRFPWESPHPVKHPSFLHTNGAADAQRSVAEDVHTAYGPLHGGHIALIVIGLIASLCVVLCVVCSRRGRTMASRSSKSLALAGDQTKTTIVDEEADEPARRNSTASSETGINFNV